MDSNEIEENQPIGTFVGQLHTIDPDDQKVCVFIPTNFWRMKIPARLISLWMPQVKVFLRLYSIMKPNPVISSRCVPDQFGAEYVEEIGIEVLDTTVPIVHTRLPVLENGRLRIGGQIEHRGGLERATRTGILVSWTAIYPGIIGTDRVQEFNIQLTAGASVYSSLTDSR